MSSGEARITVAEVDRVRWIEKEWRVGRTLGRTIYAQWGPAPTKDDTFLGIVESRSLASHIVMIHNELIRKRS